MASLQVPLEELLFLLIPESSMNAAYALLRAFPLDLALIMRASITLVWIVAGILLLKKSIVGSVAPGTTYIENQSDLVAGD